MEIKIIGSLILLTSASIGFASEYVSTGLVKAIYVVLGTNAQFSIEEFTSAGSCPTNDGLVAIRIPDNTLENLLNLSCWHLK